MIYKKIGALLGILGVMSGLLGQQIDVATNSQDELTLNGLPKLSMPVGYSTKPLPARKDNSKLIYFSGIYSQFVWNCNQAASIWTMFTYEINCLRGLNSSWAENQYDPMEIYNLLNNGNGSNGVSYFDSWSLIKANGIAGNSDFSNPAQNAQLWMTGYDKYYRGMKNRIDEVFAIDVSNEEGLLTLKHWMHDHLNGSPYGGLANFQIGSDGMVIPTIPMDKGLEEEGMYILTKYGPYVGHAMTFAGWNDEVKYDVNGDGRYTNNIDINGDGVVNMKDWEIGAMLVVNSWGTGWGNNGKVWVMYRVLAEQTKDGGIWNNAAMVVKAKKIYDPLLTVKAKIRYTERNRLKIQVGISSDLAARQPDRILEFPCFNFQGDNLPMRGFSDVDSDLLEFGLDITPLLNYFPANGQAKIFLEVIQKSPNSNASGKVESFSVMDYSNGNHEFANTGGLVTITRNSITRLSVPVTIPVNKPSIVNETLTDAQVGSKYQVQIEADGTTGPYKFANPANQFSETPNKSTISFVGGSKVFDQPEMTYRIMDLPFSFPFYDGNYNQITILSDGGFVMGQSLVTYPYVIGGSLRFYQNKGVFPFFSTLYYPDAYSKVTFAASETEAVIRWHATLDVEGLQPVEFAARILPNGQIWFYYGNMSVTPDYSWISGVSEGTNRNFYLMDHNNSGIKNNTTFTVDLLDWPTWLSLTTDGELTGTPTKSGLYSLPFTVTDQIGISGAKTLTLKVNGGSSIETVGTPDGIHLWPNPMKNDLWMEVNSTRSGNLHLTVFDLTGRELVAKDYAVQAGLMTIHCTDLRDLKSGVYLYKLSGAVNAQGKLLKSK